MPGSCPYTTERWAPVDSSHRCRLGQFSRQLCQVGEPICILSMSNSERLNYLPQVTQLLGGKAWFEPRQFTGEGDNGVDGFPLASPPPYCHIGPLRSATRHLLPSRACSRGLPGGHGGQRRCRQALASSFVFVFVFLNTEHFKTLHVIPAQGPRSSSPSCFSVSACAAEVSTPRPSERRLEALEWWLQGGCTSHREPGAWVRGWRAAGCHLGRSEAGCAGNALVAQSLTVPAGSLRPIAQMRILGPRVTQSGWGGVSRRVWPGVLPTLP